MVNFSDPSFQSVKKEVSQYSKRSLVTLIGGFITMPQFSSNAIRVELLAHLAVACANGKEEPTRTSVKKIFNQMLGGHQVSVLEDPNEDVFVSNISTPRGNFRVFNGLWEANDYCVQKILDMERGYSLNDENKKAIDCAYAILALSEEVARRAKVSRYETESNIYNDKKDLPIVRSDDFKNISSRVIFSQENLESLGVTKSSLIPFILGEKDVPTATEGRLGHSKLERMPLVEFGEDIIFVLPNAVGIALRRYFIEVNNNNDDLDGFSYSLQTLQFNQLKDELFREFRSEYRAVDNIISSEQSGLPKLNTFLIGTSMGRYIHLIFVFDDLKEVLNKGIDSIEKFSKDKAEGLSEFISSTANKCSERDPFTEGITLLVPGGMCRGIALPIGKLPKNWCIAFLNLNDLSLISRGKSDALQELFQCLIQKEWLLEKGVNINNINGDLSYYEFWRKDYYCIPKDFEVSSGSNLTLLTDFVYPVRRELRVYGDNHVQLDIDGRFKEVERLTKQSLFKSDELMPVYVSIDDLKNGEMNGVIEYEEQIFWFGVKPGFPKELRDLVYEWWRGFIDLFCKIFVDSKGMLVNVKSNFNLKVELDFSKVDIYHNNLEASDSGLTAEVFENLIVITLGSGFLVNFSTVENKGEKAFTKFVFEEVVKLLQAYGHKCSQGVSEYIDNLFSNQDLRLVHAYTSLDVVEAILHSNAGHPNFVSEYLPKYWLIKLGNSKGASPKLLTGKKECAGYLHSLVDTIWMELRVRLERLDREALIRSLLDSLNDVEQDRLRWNRTARALAASYSEDDVVRVSRERESKRSEASLCYRALIEMSICHAPLELGLIPDRIEIETLLSLCSLMVTTAYDSDAIHLGMVEPSLSINNNGTYEIESDIFNEILMPYFLSHYDQLHSSAVNSYDELYKVGDSGSSGRKDSVFFTDGFPEAFESEYGISLDDHLDCSSELLDLLVEKREIYGKFKLSDLIEKISENRNKSKEVIVKYLHEFSLTSRESWDVIPDGFLERDIFPWKFKRRLSCLFKPVLFISEDTVVLSLPLLRLGMAYFLDKVVSGEVHPSFFKSEEMKAYTGEKIEKNGRNFTLSVAKVFEDNGFCVETEVPMTKLGASELLGDVDVLAIGDDGDFYIIECKNLQMAKTISEIADVLTRFRGEEKDELRKHINRCEWVNQNLTEINKKSVFKRELKNPTQYLITSVEMPIRFGKTLPVGYGEILSFRELKTRFL